MFNVCVFELFLILVICKNVIVGCVSKNYNKKEGCVCLAFSFYYLFYFVLNRQKKEKKDEKIKVLFS
jgi:hypothetical protein